MKKVFEKIMQCEDMDAIKNCISLLAEQCEIGMNNECLLETLKAVQGEIDGCHYDEEIAKLHLCLIDKLSTIDEAKDYWHKIDKGSELQINIWDWCVLWGEMDRQNKSKIYKWFPNIRKVDYEEKIFDECLSFLDSNKHPYNDINL